MTCTYATPKVEEIGGTANASSFLIGSRYALFPPRAILSICFQRRKVFERVTDLEETSPGCWSKNGSRVLARQSFRAAKNLDPPSTNRAVPPKTFPGSRRFFPRKNHGNSLYRLVTPAQH